MARALVGGLLSSSLITLVVVPTIYALFERRQAKDETPAAVKTADFQPPKPLGEEST